MEGTYLEEPGVTDTSVYTVNGIATVSVNSGTAPGTVRVEVSVDCDEDGDYEINANAVPVIIASGARITLNQNMIQTQQRLSEVVFIKLNVLPLSMISGTTLWKIPRMFIGQSIQSHQIH